MNDSTTLPDGTVIPDINSAIAAKGPEFLLGMDTPRIWATGVQVFAAPGTSMFVFREQNLVGDPGGVIQPVIKNVSSVILPTEIVRDLHRVLTEQLAILDGANAGS